MCVFVCVIIMYVCMYAFLSVFTSARPFDGVMYKCVYVKDIDTQEERQLDRRIDKETDRQMRGIDR